MFRSISQLEAYYWVARLGNFHAAADRLNVSQPSITQSIRSFEAAVGYELFVRRHKGVLLTEQGSVLFDHVSKVMTLLDEMNGHFKGIDQLKGMLRVGVPDNFAETCLPTFLAILKRDYPELSVSVRVDNSRALIQRLEEGLLDIAMLTRPQVTDGYGQEFLGKVKVAWVSAPSLIQNTEKITPLWLSRQVIVTNSLPSPTHADLTGWFDHHKLVPTRIVTCNNVSAIVKSVVAGQGICVLARCIVKQQLEDGRLIELDIPPSLPQSETYIVYPKRALNRGMKEIIEVFRESVKDNYFLEED